MDIRIEPDGHGRYIIACPPEITWSARVDLSETLQAAVGDEQLTGVIVDLQKTTYINSAGLGAIFSLRKHVIERDAAIVVARPQPSIVRLLQTINLSALIPVTSTLDDARRRLESDAAPS
jgi:anti-anti-sigma factor